MALFGKWASEVIQNVSTKLFSNLYEYATNNKDIKESVSKLWWEETWEDICGQSQRKKHYMYNLHKCSWGSILKVESEVQVIMEDISEDVL